MWSHEESYKRFDFGSLVHRRRLEKIVSVIKGLHLKSEGKWADFGCSNGFILSVIQDRCVLKQNWHFYGLDHKESLLENARVKGLRNTEYNLFDLNTVNDSYKDNYDVVTCFETLEHTGDYKNAFENLYLSCKKDGLIVLSIPNEVGIPGILKFFGRKFKRRNVYGEFFKNKRESDYLISLLCDKDIEFFRREHQSGWGPHLGFDYRKFIQFLENNYISKNKCKVESVYSAFLNFNKLYVLRKCS